MADDGDMWTLALDQGGHATRARVFDERGIAVAGHEAAIATRRPAPGEVEHDAPALWDSVQDCLAAVGRSLGADATRIGAAALCTQRSTALAWSRADGAALSPVLSWQDQRGAGRLRDLALSEAEVQAITGLRRSPHYGASKLRWCLDELGAVASAARDGTLALGPLSSWLVQRLSGGACLAVDPCNASRTLLWDLATRDWSPRLCRAFGVPREALPDCAPNRGAWGSVAVGAARVPLVVVTGDQSAVPFAFDAIPGRAFLTLGTGAFLQRPVAARPTTSEGLLASVLWADADEVRFALEGTINGAGAALAWIAERQGRSEAALLAELPEGLERIVAPPLFINAVGGGLGSPFWRSGLEPRFAGEGDAAAQAVAGVESIVFLIAANLEAMARSGHPVESLVVVGGLARLDGLLTRIAALGGVRVERALDLEATAYGAARLANPGLPALAAQAMARHGTAAALAPPAAAGLQQRYRAWQDALPASQD